MAAILVFMFKKSTARFFAGICTTNPGDRNAKSAAAISGAAQSFIVSLKNCPRNFPVVQLFK